MIEIEELEALYLLFKKYFAIEEIVSKKFYTAYKGLGYNGILSRFDFRLIANMCIIREALGKSITINNWKWGGPFDERGYRDISTDMVKAKIKKGNTWASPHLFGAAFDFDVEGMTATEVRKWLKENADMLPFPIRLERNLKGKEISWVHMDVCYDPKNPKVYEFDV